MNWLYLPDSKTYLNMTYVQEVRYSTFGDGLYVVMSNDNRLDFPLQGDVDKIIEYLDRIAYC